jgi:hypothetical protein
LTITHKFHNYMEVVLVFLKHWHYADIVCIILVLTGNESYETIIFRPY